MNFERALACQNCKREIPREEGGGLCSFCEAFGGSDPEKLNAIRKFATAHYRRGYHDSTLDDIEDH